MQAACVFEGGCIIKGWWSYITEVRGKLEEDHFIKQNLRTLFSLLILTSTKWVNWFLNKLMLLNESQTTTGFYIITSLLNFINTVKSRIGLR